MNDQFEQWQQQYQQSTPSIDVVALAKQVSRAQKREKIKAWTELFAGLLVSAYCVYAAIYFADSTLGVMVFAILSIIPISFSLWAFKARQKQWVLNGADVTQLLNIKRQHLHKQLRYWHLSAIGSGILWLGLLVYCVLSFMLTNMHFVNGFTLVAANSVVLGATVFRYIYLRKNIQTKLNNIDALEY